ncbi:MAG: hypothetical protein JWR67_4017 [Mucilaginibacter sp.]|nr:hypothetical protein [Mucilaginibacter sp.]
MSEQKHSFRHNTLNLDQAYYYALLIYVEATSFSVAVTYNDQLLAYETNCALNELNDPQQLQDILSATYKKTIVALSSSVFSLVPDPLFNPDHITGFARLLDVKANEKVLAQVLDEKNHVVYKVYEQQWTAIAKLDLKNLVFASKGWIKAIAQNNPLNNQLYVNIGNNTIEFLYFKHNNIRLYNTFEFNNADDVVYFSTLVTDELDMLPPYTTLVLSGNITGEDEIYTHLTAFFPDVVLNKIKLLELPEQIAPHQILSLAALTLCESSEAV